MRAPLLAVAVLCLSVVLLPLAAAKPLPPPPAVCGGDPCVEPDVVVNGDEVRVGYRHHVGLGGHGGVYSGDQGTYVYYGEGITSCKWGVDGAGNPKAGCVF